MFIFNNRSSSDVHQRKKSEHTARLNSIEQILHRRCSIRTHTHTHIRLPMMINTTLTSKMFLERILRVRLPLNIHNITRSLFVTDRFFRERGVRYTTNKIIPPEEHTAR